MKSFIDNITPDQEKVKKIKSLGKHPFKNVPVFHGGFQNMYHFNFDKTCVKLSALKKLEKYIKYVPLNEISPRLSGRSFFTIACVCDIAQSVLSISDLKNTKFSLLAEECPTLQKFDMIAFANAEVSITLRIRSSDQIIKIGHCEKVVKCSQCETNHSDKCTTFVDIRNGPTCDFHCHQLVMKSADDRPMLKMAQNQMKFQQDFSPLTSPERIPSVFHGPQIKLPDDYLTKYFENHRGSRLTKISKLINPCKDHKIGVGLNEGDIIVL